MCRIWWLEVCRLLAGALERNDRIRTKIQSCYYHFWSNHLKERQTYYSIRYHAVSNIGVLAFELRNRIFLVETIIAWKARIPIGPRLGKSWNLVLWTRSKSLWNVKGGQDFLPLRVGCCHQSARNTLESTGKRISRSMSGRNYATLRILIIIPHSTVMLNETLSS